MPKKKIRTISIKMNIDMISKKAIGVISNKDEIQSNSHIEIASRIINRIQDVFNSDGSDWINDYLNYIKDNRLIKAFNLLEKKSFFLKRPISSGFFNDLFKLDYKKLPKKKQYSFLNRMISLGYYSKFYKEIEPLVEIVLDEFKCFFDKEAQGAYYLTKSDIYIKTGNQLSANMLLNNIINDSEYSDTLKAFANRQLSWLCTLDKDKLIYIERAHDLFLVTGYKREAIEELIGAYDILLSNSPDIALSKIDLAIQLLESESIINREISAFLYIKKATVLYMQKSYNESFKEVEKAIDLQNDMIGNETTKYSIFTFAEELMRIIGNREKQNEFSRIAILLKNRLQNDNYMNIKFSLEEAANMDKVISDELKEKVMKNGAPDQQFGFYLFSALNKNTPYEEKLIFLDKALQIQEKNLPNGIEKSLVYTVIAEIYNEHNDIVKAIEWYEKAFSIAPYDKVILQNYIHLLEKSNSWDRLENICGLYIKIVGYFPNLYYVYGKSLLNQSKYEEAFVAFGKCKNDLNFSIDKEIIECSEHISYSTSITELVSSEKKRINKDDFLNAAKEVTDAISQKSRMHLWKYEKKTKSYKWVSKPEEEVKNLFIQGIIQKYNSNYFEIIDEVKTGAGRIDLYVIIGSYLKIIIELKICGCGYSSNYANSGQKQLVGYLESKNLFYGVLIVFDGRIRDFSKGFKQVISIDNRTINTIVVDMRPKV